MPALKGRLWGCRLYDAGVIVSAVDRSCNVKVLKAFRLIGGDDMGGFVARGLAQPSFKGL